MPLQAGEMLAQLDLQGCPEGTVLDPNEPDQSVEEQYFSDWANPLTAPRRWRMASCYRVVEDEGQPVLEHIDKTDRCLVTGEALWADYAVEAEIRPIRGLRLSWASSETCR